MKAVGVMKTSINDTLGEDFCYELFFPDILGSDIDDDLCAEHALLHFSNLPDVHFDTLFLQLLGF